MAELSECSVQTLQYEVQSKHAIEKVNFYYFYMVGDSGRNTGQGGEPC